VHRDIVEEGFPCFDPAKTTNIKVWAAGDMVYASLDILISLLIPRIPCLFATLHVLYDVPGLTFMPFGALQCECYLPDFKSFEQNI